MKANRDTATAGAAYHDVRLFFACHLKLFLCLKAYYRLVQKHMI